MQNGSVRGSWRALLLRSSSSWGAVPGVRAMWSAECHSTPKNPVRADGPVHMLNYFASEFEERDHLLRTSFESQLINIY